MPQTYTLKKTVVMIGLMGAGKTTAGRRLAKQLGVPFLDSDEEITQAAGCSIPDLFAIYGEVIFRDLEQRVISRLLAENGPCVLATGGGAWMNPEIRARVKEKAVSVWLKAEVGVLLERVSRKNTRPLLAAGDKRAILEKLMQERYPVYGTADITIASDEGAQEKVVKAVIEQLRKLQYV